MTSEVNQIAEAIVPEEFKKAKFFAVMLFYPGYEIGLPFPENNTWINTRTFKYTNYQEALNAYANIPCPASQLIEANTEEELQAQMEQMLRNYHDPKWLEENLYPYL